MNIICFPFERVIEINALILSTEPGMKGVVEIPKQQGKGKHEAENNSRRFFHGVGFFRWRRKL